MGILPNFPVLVGNLTICIDVRFTPADNYSILVGNDWLRLAQADLLLQQRPHASTPQQRPVGRHSY